MVQPRLLFAHHLLFYLAPGLLLLLSEVHLFAVLGLLLLVLDHLLERGVLEGLLLLLHLEVLLLLVLLLFNVVNFSAHFVFETLLLVLDVGLELLLQSPVLLLDHHLLFLLLSHAFHLLLVVLHVALALRHYVFGAFLGLVDLLPRLRH